MLYGAPAPGLTQYSGSILSTTRDLMDGTGWSDFKRRDRRSTPDRPQIPSLCPLGRRQLLMC